MHCNITTMHKYTLLMTRYLRTLFIFLTIFSSSLVYALDDKVVINEVMPANVSYMFDGTFCLLISFAGEFFQRNPFLRWVYWILERMGIYSFELYLVHSFLYAYLMKDIIPLFSGVPNNLLWLATIPVVLIGCFLLNRSAAMVSFLLAKVTNHLSKIL